MLAEVACFLLHELLMTGSFAPVPSPLTLAGGGRKLRSRGRPMFHPPQPVYWTLRSSLLSVPLRTYCVSASRFEYRSPSHSTTDTHLKVISVPLRNVHYLAESQPSQTYVAMFTKLELFTWILLSFLIISAINCRYIWTVPFLAVLLGRSWSYLGNELLPGIWNQPQSLFSVFFDEWYCWDTMWFNVLPFTDYRSKSIQDAYRLGGPEKLRHYLHCVIHVRSRASRVRDWIRIFRLCATCRLWQRCRPYQTSQMDSLWRQNLRVQSTP